MKIKSHERDIIHYLRKSFLIMRLTLFILLFSTAFAFSTSSYSQNTRLSLHLKNSSVKQVLTAIEESSEYIFFYQDQNIDLNRKVSIDADEKVVTEILDQLFRGTGNVYKIRDRQITIGKNAVDLEKMMVAAVPSGLAAGQQPQRVEIKGTITDNSGNTIPGVAVTIKGTTQGTVTDAQGQYKISVPVNSTLIFSFVGMKSSEIVVKAGMKVIDVEMATTTKEIDDVVVTGYQSRTKSSMVGAVSTVKSSELQSAGAVTLDKAISGKLAGVYIRSGSGQPGEVGEIRIRGINTMTGDKEPLYVLDGMPLQSGEVSGGASRIMTTGIGNIPPEDIESITILKDAAAASIYGSRAANGVVVITTKSGSIGKDYITYTGKFGITTPPKNKFDFMNSAEKVQFERGLYNDFHPVYGGRVIQLMNKVDNGIITAADAEAQIAKLASTNTNWMDEIYDTAPSQSHNISMSGGNAKTQYYASANYQYNEGTLMNNKYQNGTLNMKLSHYFNKNFLMRFNMYSTLKHNRKPNSLLDPFKYAAFANPYETPYNADGSYASDMSYRDLTNDVTYTSDLNYTKLNIIRELNENTLTSMYGNMRGQFSVEYSFLNGFRFISTATGDYTTVHDIDESNAGTYRSYYNNWIKGARGNAILEKYNQGFLNETMGRTFNYTLRNSLEFARTFKEKHMVQLFLAQDVSGTTNFRFNHNNPIYLQEYRIAGYPTWGDINSSTNSDMVSAKYNLLNLSAFGGTSFRENRSVSFISSVVYSYNDRYVFNGNLRYDGVDIIGSDNQFTPLWSSAVKWNAHNESFLKSQSDWLSRLVISLGYGYRGSINRTVYPFHVYTLGSVNYDGLQAASSISYGNPVLKWEKKGEKTLGLEASFFKGRVNLEGQLFQEKVTDLLDNVILPASIGRTYTTVNVGSLTNKGWELSARFEVLKSKHLLFELGGNISMINNNLDKAYNNLIPNIANSYPQFVQGYPTNSWFGYKFSHINEKNGHNMVWAQKETVTTENGVVKRTLADQLIDLEATNYSLLQSTFRTYNLGHRDPDMFGGLNSRVVYRDFELAAQFVFASGNKILDFQDRLSGPSGITDDVTASRTNRLKENLYRWRQPGDVTDIAVFGNTASNYAYYLIDRDLSDGSYLKCSQLALSWRMPAGTLKNSVLNTMRVSLTANNLFTLTNYRGTDPEAQTPFAYPNTQTYTLSMTLGF